VSVRTEHSTVSGGNPPEAREQRRIVMVVDDSPVDRSLAGRILADQSGIEVVYAKNGVDALELMERQTPDLVLTDLLMPEMNGLELVEAIRRRFPYIPSVLMTAHGSEDTAIQALQKGATSYVPKRNLARTLQRTIRNVFSVSHPGRQRQRLAECWSKSEFEFCPDNDTSLIPVLVTHLQDYVMNVRSCDETEFMRVGLALHEALLNAMHHGNLELSSELRAEDDGAYYRLAEERRKQPPYRDRRVHVRAVESQTESCYIIRDEGPGFDTERVRYDPSDLSHLERPSGRGLFLIRTFMHDVQFNERGNQITMRHRRDATEGEGEEQAVPDEDC